MQPNEITEFSSLQEVEQAAAKLGVRFTSSDHETIRKAQAEARKTIAAEAEAQQAERGNGLADRFMNAYPKLLAAIAAAGNVIITFSQAVIVNLGAPIVLVLLLIVEQQRVLHGMALFESSAELANFGAWALVMVNLGLEIIAHHIEFTKGYEAERQTRWSLRIWAKNMAYRLGIGSNWHEQTLSPAAWAHGALSLVTMTILALALAGSMRVVIEQQQGAWYMAIVDIATKSSLLDMMTWLGGLLFAAAAVITAQRLSRYIAIRTVEVRREMIGDNAENQARIEQAAAIAAAALLQDKIRKAKAVAEKKSVTVETKNQGVTSVPPAKQAVTISPVQQGESAVNFPQAVTASSNGNGNGNHS